MRCGAQVAADSLVAARELSGISDYLVDYLAHIGGRIYMQGPPPPRLRPRA